VLFAVANIAFPSNGLSKHRNLAKIPRAEVLGDREDGPWMIFQDMAILLDGFFGPGRYEPRDERMYNPHEDIGKECSTILLQHPIKRMEKYQIMVPSKMKNRIKVYDG